MQTIRSKATAAAAALILTASLTACSTRTYQSYPLSDAASQRVHAAFAEQSAALERAYAEGNVQVERKAYLAQLLERFRKYESYRIELLSKRLTPREAQQIDRGAVVGLQLFETWARFPGRVDQDGNPVDNATKQALSEVQDFPTSAN